MKKIKLVAVLAAGALALTGCSGKDYKSAGDMVDGLEKAGITCSGSETDADNKAVYYLCGDVVAAWFTDHDALVQFNDRARAEGRGKGSSQVVGGQWLAATQDGVPTTQLEMFAKEAGKKVEKID